MVSLRGPPVAEGKDQPLLSPLLPLAGKPSWNKNLRFVSTAESSIRPQRASFEARLDGRTGRAGRAMMSNRIHAGAASVATVSRYPTLFKRLVAGQYPRFPPVNSLSASRVGDPRIRRSQDGENFQAGIGCGSDCPYVCSGRRVLRVIFASNTTPEAAIIHGRASTSLGGNLTQAFWAAT